MKINLMSFGYAYGIPMEADMVLDVQVSAKPLFCGRTAGKNRAFAGGRGVYQIPGNVYRKYFLFLSDFLVYLIPLFENEGKSYLTICFGCTGGKHRSVFIVNELTEKSEAMGYNVSTIHRDIHR